MIGYRLTLTPAPPYAERDMRQALKRLLRDLGMRCGPITVAKAIDLSADAVVVEAPPPGG